jgi:hypothetical protein
LSTNGVGSTTGYLVAAEDFKISTTDMEVEKSFSLLARLVENTSSVYSKTASVSSSFCCVYLRYTDGDSLTNSLRAQFLFPPKCAAIPVSDSGLIYLTLDRRTEAGGGKEFLVRSGDFLVSCEIVQHPFPFTPPLSLRNMPEKFDMAIPMAKAERLSIPPRQKTWIKLCIVDLPVAFQQSLLQCTTLPRLIFKKFSQHVQDRHHLEIIARAVTLQRDGSVSLPILNRSESKEVVLKQGQFFGLMMLVPPSFCSFKGTERSPSSTCSSTTSKSSQLEDIDGVRSNIQLPGGRDWVKNLPLPVPCSGKRGASALEDDTSGAKDCCILKKPENGNKTPSSSDLDLCNRSKIQKVTKHEVTRKLSCSKLKNHDKELIKKEVISKKQNDKVLTKKKINNREMIKKDLNKKKLNDCLPSVTESTKMIDNSLKAQKINFTNLFDEQKNTSSSSHLAANLPIILVRVHLGQHILPSALTTLHYVAAIAVNPQTETVTKKFTPLPSEDSDRVNKNEHHYKIQLSHLIAFFASLRFQIDGDCLVLVVVSSALCPTDPVKAMENMIRNNNLAEDFILAVDGTTDMKAFRSNMLSFPEKDIYWKSGQKRVTVGDTYEKAAATVRNQYLEDSWVTPMIKEFLVSSCVPVVRLP